jgi:poly-gamma-glutamate synthesis protein (capsule biosynthesis protein)
MADEFVLAAVGDIEVRPTGQVPESVGWDADEQFDLVRNILTAADLTFGQLETPISNRNTPVRPGAAPRAELDPDACARSLIAGGLNVMSFAGNHTSDMGPDAIADTLAAAAKHGLVLMGAGMNIADARKPAIVEVKGTKVGFLAYASVVPKDAEARTDKPGMAPVRATDRYERVDWQPGSPPKVISEAVPEDLAAMIDDIETLRPQVEVLAISFHWGIHFEPATVAMYQRQVGHAAIDAGADVILGHHSHILKPIEVYNGKAIIYSMGNFVFDCSFSRMSNWNIVEHYGVVMDPERPAYGMPYDSQKTVIVKCHIADKRIQSVGFVPCWINKKVQPEPLKATGPRSEDVKRYMEWMCQHERMPTTFHREGDEVVIDLD